MDTHTVDFESMVAAGWEAEARGDWPEAIRRWYALDERFPDRSLGLNRVGACFLASDRNDDAEAVFAVAADRFPDAPGVMCGRAWVATQQKNWREADNRWKRAIERFPDHEYCYSGYGTTLRRQKRYNEAEAIVVEGARRFPDSGPIGLELADIATARGDWATAVGRWLLYRQRHPHMIFGHIGLSSAFRRLGCLGEAEAALQVALERFPHHASFAVDHAWVANTRSDWPEARRRWQALLERYPDREHDVTAGLEYIRTNGGEPSSGEGAPAQSHPTPGEVSRGGASADGDSSLHCVPTTSISQERDGKLADTAARLLRHFDSLGDNCEFGLVQRYFGAEAIGLLRWSGTTIDKLTAAIEADFSGVGDPVFTRLEVTGGEYFTEDTRWGMRMHTFIREHQADRALVYEQLCLRLRYLARKMRQGLASPEKIYVFRSPDDRAAEGASALLGAVRRHGPGTLLHVRLSDATHAPGEVVMAERGLITGYIDRIGVFGDRGLDTSYDLWLRICRGAIRLWRPSLDLR